VAVLLYLTVPAAFQVQAIAYLTNAFAQSMAVIGFALLTLASSTLAGWLILAASFTALTLAVLSHTGTFMICTVVLVLIAPMLWMIGDRAARWLAPRAAAVAMLTILVSIGIYYAHFSDEYRTMLAGSPVSSSQAATAIVPIQRAEAHQTQWAPGWLPLRNRLVAIPGYVSKYLGFILVALAVGGTVFLIRASAHDSLTIALAAWCGACGLFFVLGQLTSIDVRYYLAAAPALAVLAARAVAETWTRGGTARVIGIAALSWCVATGIAYWFAWFGPVLPR
jgi:hypothetical protein